MSAPSFFKLPLRKHSPNMADFEATIVSDGEIEFESVAREFPWTPESKINRLLDPLSLARPPLVLQENCLVLKTGRGTILFDTGMGASTTLGKRAGRLPHNLAAAGIRPEQIDAIVLTHLHCDHAWGLIDASDAPTFPNAKVFVSEIEFDSSTRDRGSWKIESPPTSEVLATRACLAPYRDRLSFVTDGVQFLEGITPISTPGHTSGHMSYVIASAGHRLFNIGDLCHHHKVQFPNPRWHFRWDDNPAQAAFSRLNAFAMAADKGLDLIGFHLPFPGVGRVKREGRGFRFLSSFVASS